MKKRAALSLLLLNFMLRLPAQLPSGAIAPDFTAQDIAGQTWHLYGLLDQGKTVVLEVGATWCWPCWAYHNNQAMQDFYEQHGPEGDGKVQVLFVEGDPATNVDCLYGMPGCSVFSPGNWVNGTTYPYLDNAAIADSFQVSYYPTFFIICPNKKIYQIGQLDADKLWEKTAGCPVAFGINNAGIFEHSTGSDLREVCDTLTVTPSFSLINLGSDALTEATVSLQWNSTTAQTIHWNGNLPLYGEASIIFDPLPLNDTGVLKTTISSINNGLGDDDFSNNVHNNFFVPAEQFTTPQVILKIKTDNYGAETYWELRDERDSVLHRGGNLNVGPNGGGLFTGLPGGPGAYGNNVLINKTLALPGNGCYSILFVDAYGDGMCCDYGNGYYKLYNANNPTVPIITGGEFEATEHRGFGLTGTSSSEHVPDPPRGLLLAPNPAADVLNISFTLAEPANVSAMVFNRLGQQVHVLTPRQLSAGEHLWPLTIDDWAQGSYFIRFQEDSRTSTHKFFVSPR